MLCDFDLEWSYCYTLYPYDSSSYFCCYCYHHYHNDHHHNYHYYHHNDIDTYANLALDLLHPIRVYKTGFRFAKTESSSFCKCSRLCDDFPIGPSFGIVHWNCYHAALSNQVYILNWFILRGIVLATYCLCSLCSEDWTYAFFMI